MVRAVQSSPTTSISPRRRAWSCSSRHRAVANDRDARVRQMPHPASQTASIRWRATGSSTPPGKRAQGTTTYTPATARSASRPRSGTAEARSEAARPTARADRHDPPVPAGVAVSRRLGRDSTGSAAQQPTVTPELWLACGHRPAAADHGSNSDACPDGVLRWAPSPTQRSRPRCVPRQSHPFGRGERALSWSLGAGADGQSSSQSNFCFNSICAVCAFSSLKLRNPIAPR